MAILHDDYELLERLYRQPGTAPTTRQLSALEQGETLARLRREHPHVDHELRSRLLAGGPVDVPLEARAMGATARVAVAATGFAELFQTALPAAVPLLEVATVVTTTTGGPVTFGYVSSFANAAGVVDDNATATAGDPVFGAAVSPSLWPFRHSDPVSEEFVRDTLVDVEALWARTFAAKLRSDLAVQLWAGDGTTEPEGLTAGVSSGVTAGSATVLTVGDVVSALAALPDEFVNENTAILLSPSAYWDLRAQMLGTGSSGGWAWDPSTGDTLFGFRVRREPQLAATATGAVSAVVGDFSNGYLVRLAPVRLEFNPRADFIKDQGAVRIVLRADGRRLNCANSLRKITMA